MSGKYLIPTTLVILYAKYSPLLSAFKYVPQAQLLPMEFTSCKVSLPAANQRAGSVVVNNVGD